MVKADSYDSVFGKVMSNMCSMSNIGIQSMQHDYNANRFSNALMAVSVQLNIFSIFLDFEVDPILLMKNAFSLWIWSAIFLVLNCFFDSFLFLLFGQCPPGLISLLHLTWNPMICFKSNFINLTWFLIYGRYVQTLYKFINFFVMPIKKSNNSQSLYNNIQTWNR